MSAGERRLFNVVGEGGRKRNVPVWVVVPIVAFTGSAPARTSGAGHERAALRPSSHQAGTGASPSPGYRGLTHSIPRPRDGSLGPDRGSF